MDTNQLQSYQRIEASLRQLLAALPSTISASDRREAKEKIDHHEFGIALQVIGAIIVEYDIALDAPTKRLMRELMEEAGMNREEDEDYWFWEQMLPILQG